MNKQSVYREILLNEIWRVVSLIDRNPYSKTKGSFSRIHWGWKFDDFPYPRLQEGVYTLCRLHDLADEKNPFYQSDAMRSWIEWGFEYWANLQHTDGSFDEAYPNEKCLAATAFTSFYLGGAYLLWRDRLPPGLQKKLETGFLKAGCWLCRNSETHGLLSNHLAVTVAGLNILSIICNNNDFSQRTQYFLDRILCHQSVEGWMKEYDGADIGYGTHCFFYLADYWQRTGCNRTLKALINFAEFIQFFVHPDGTLGGEYSSRNTEFYYPAGFEIVTPLSPTCAAIAAFLKESMRDRRVCGIWSMDLFNLFPMLNNLFFALDHETVPSESPALPWQSKPFERYFSESGLWIVNRDHFYAVIGISKGGTVSVFDKDKRQLAARYAGYFIQSPKQTFTCHDYQLRPPVIWEKEFLCSSFRVPWKEIRIPVFSSLTFLAFRIFTLTLGRTAWISRWVKNLLVTVLIRNKQRPPIDHRRTIRVVEDGIVINDVLTLPTEISSLTVAEHFVSIHMGSSMYADIRTVGTGSTLIVLQCAGRVSIRGKLSLNGSEWEVVNS